jgi:enoyl-CoA hydratase/carnithine racemase
MVTASTDEPITVEQTPLGRGTLSYDISLDRPETLNALNWSMVKAIHDAVDEAEAMPEVRVVTLRGNGRSFCSGGDLNGYVDLQKDPVAFPQFVHDFHALLLRMIRSSLPTVALVHGHATAGGLELLLGVDVVLAERSALIGDCHINFGQMGGGGTLSLLARYVGVRRATDLILSGRMLTAEAALEWGLVTEVVDDGDLPRRSLELAGQLARRSPGALTAAKRVLRQAWSDSLPLESALALEQQANAFYCLNDPDAQAGLQAFGDKQEPEFSALRALPAR